MVFLGCSAVGGFEREADEFVEGMRKKGVTIMKAAEIAV
jgi:hypothetical protein